jgi:hypothetical protein
MLDKGSG